MEWNFDIGQAPKNEKIITASKCGRVIVTCWLEDSQRWNMYSKDDPPIAWYAFLDHPSNSPVDLNDMF